MRLRNALLAPVLAVLASFTLDSAISPAEAAWKYQVPSGQYLGQIAAKFPVTEDQIAAASNIKNKHKIRAGQILTIPDHKVTVQEGESLWTIASRYGKGVTHQAIKAANNLSSTTIYPNQELTIPSSTIPINQQSTAPRVRVVKTEPKKTIETVTANTGNFANYVNANKSRTLKDGTYWVDGPNFVTMGDYNSNKRSPSRFSRVLPQTKHGVHELAGYARSKGYGDIYIETNPGSKHRRKGTHVQGLGADVTLYKNGKKIQFTKKNRHIMNDMCQWLMTNKDTLNIASVIAYPGAPYATHRNKHHYDHIHISFKGKK
tara:strand:- start:6203 stop:7153 length:951 start_codon:yes stop_codon:yes gene_type:complete